MSNPTEDVLEKWESQLRKGLLEFVVLLSLREKERYGYALIRDVKEVTSLEITEGTIYPLLDRLKTEDLVVARWEEPEDGGVPRKYYHLTERGGAVLEEMESTWERMVGSIDALAEQTSETP